MCDDLDLGDSRLFRVFALLFMLAACIVSALSALLPTEAPPLLNSPVYSLATLNADGTTNMQILTLRDAGSASRASAVGHFSYEPTLTHANFVKRRSGVLQLLRDVHAPLSYALGGRSGRDDDKAAACAAAGLEWLEPQSSAWDAPERLLPECAHYLRLVQVGGELTEMRRARCGHLRRRRACWRKKSGGDVGAASPAALSPPAAAGSLGSSQREGEGGRAGVVSACFSEGFHTFLIWSLPRSELPAAGQSPNVGFCANWAL